MRGNMQGVILCAVVFAVGFLLGDVAIADLKPRVIDGDTFEYQGEKIRIRGVDTPEMKAKSLAEREAAQRAKQELERLLSRGFRIDKVGPDKYGRTVGEVFTSGGEVAEQLIEGGFGRAYLLKLPKAKAEKMLEAQRRAQNKKVGIWAKN
jgi:endonuclease YncB( thermonuclease family)